MKCDRELKTALFEQVARLAKAVANPKRLELIELLCQAPKTVEVLASEAAISLKLASAHLKELRVARLVETERHGKNIVYRIASEDVPRLWTMLRLLAEDRLFELQDALHALAEAAPEWVGEERQELLKKAESGELTVLDVRPLPEFEERHLPFARSMPLSELKARIAELPSDKPIVAYCRGPYCLMSADAVMLLTQAGYRAFRLREGVVEWDAAVLAESSRSK
jgi:rhodanese-related sulfurtransferase